KKITLIEAAPRVLPRSTEKGSTQVAKRLKKLGITVKTNMKVEEATLDSLTVSGKPLATHTIIWTSGVTNAPFYKDNAEHFTLNERGKIVVDEYLRARDDIYVIGDNAATPYAGLAQTALHDAIFLADHLDGDKKKYKPYLPPSVIPIGHNWALFEWRKLHFAGFLGGWMHRLSNLVGFKDLLPFGGALKAWRATRQKQLRIPDKID
ncbi:MAG: NAD(P)/FAD-dependent oxidoreductase, partial [Candidatus Saccharimonadales bacterium]